MMYFAYRALFDILLLATAGQLVTCEAMENSCSTPDCKWTDEVEDEVSLLQYSAKSTTQKTQEPSLHAHDGSPFFMQLNAALHKVSQSRNLPPGSATAMLPQVRDMVQAKLNDRSADIDTDVLDEVLQLMNVNVITAAATDHATEQEIINNAVQDITNCGTVMQSAFTATDGINDLKSKAISANVTHYTCRTSQVSKAATKETKCDAFREFRGSLEKESCSPFPTATETNADAQEKCLNSWKAWSTSNLESFQEKKAECGAAKEALEAQKIQCSEDQDAFEQAFCDYAATNIPVCGQYSTCFETQTSEYEETKAGVEVAEAGRKAEYSAAKKIICFMTVLNSTNQEAKFEECKNMVVDTSSLDMTYPDIPAVEPCDKSYAESGTCSTHYLGWAAEAPVDDCTECSIPGAAGTEAEWTLALSNAVINGDPVTDVGADQFNYMFQNSRSQLVKRICSSCSNSNYETIYYKRLTPVPATLSMYELLALNWINENNVLNIDFELYSTHDDAINGNNRWTYCNYNDKRIGFPRDCGPAGFVGGQWNSITISGVGTSRGGQKVAFYIDTKSTGTTTAMPGEMECTFEVGDGTGGREKGLGSAPTREACVLMVKEKEPTANGVTYHAPGKGTLCYAEFDMTGSNGNSAWQTCQIPPATTTTTTMATTTAPLVVPSDGAGWVKILEYSESSGYSPTKDASGTLSPGTAASTFAKLSDADINALAGNKYKLRFMTTEPKKSGKNLYMDITGVPYDDLAIGMGYKGHPLKMCSAPAMASCTWKDHSMSRFDSWPWIDAGDDCDRWFMDLHNRPSCYGDNQANTRKRCLSAGQHCKMHGDDRWPNVMGFTVWLKPE